MKRFVSVWNMLKKKRGFTLIEVIVAVMIITIVIMALLQMRGNSSHMFLNFSKKLEVNQYISFINLDTNQSDENYNTTIDKMLNDFDIENDLRKKLKNIKVKIIYQKLKQIDLSQNEDDNVSSDVIFEIDKMILKTDTASTSLIRLNLQ